MFQHANTFVTLVFQGCPWTGEAALYSQWVISNGKGRFPTSEYASVICSYMPWWWWIASSRSCSSEGSSTSPQALHHESTLLMYWKKKHTQANERQHSIPCIRIRQRTPKGNFSSAGLISSLKECSVVHKLQCYPKHCYRLLSPLTSASITLSLFNQLHTLLYLRFFPLVFHQNLK